VSRSPVSAWDTGSPLVDAAGGWELQVLVMLLFAGDPNMRFGSVTKSSAQ
jgi:hypothetical protein